MPQSWGYHAMLNLGGCDLTVTTDPVALDAWASDLVAALGMTPFGAPQIVHFGEGRLAGWTVSQLITTSNVTAHFNDDGTAFIDVFSCKDYALSTVIEQARRIIKPKTLHVVFLSRQAGIYPRELARQAVAQTPAAV